MNFLPILIFDDSIYSLLHLLREGWGIGRELLGRWAAPFLCFLPVLVLVSSTAAAGAGCDVDVVVTVSLSFPRCLFVTNFLLYVLQIPFLYGLW